jgi:tRNA (mo5U34)-methyltransferase
MSPSLNLDDDAVLTAEINKYFWWHPIKVREGITTPGQKKALHYELKVAFDPVDLHGKTVLDTGAWNGGWSVEASRRGAKSVLALDHPTWYSPKFRGRETFDLMLKACKITNVEGADQDLDAPGLSLSKFGSFDVVLYMGLFYHLKDPLAALRELAKLTKEVMIIETYVCDVELEDKRPVMMYYPGKELNKGGSNWWGPNRQCMADLLKTEGFKRVVTSPGANKTRGIFHAWR